MKRLTILFLLFILPLLSLACNPVSKEEGTIEGKTENKKETAVNDEQEFYALLKNFKKELAAKNSSGLSKLMNFPFYTSQQQLENGSTGIVADPIDVQDFKTYQKSIYNTDVVKLMPASGNENLSVIEDSTDEAYYRSIRKLTDKGSKLYELYMQYPEQGNQAEGYFAFVFGKVNGKYRALAYYAKWPVK